ncbi:rhodanese-like domain-containing protein [bacterium]|nr:rhodanese-like domain-containing protein [bacterium]
MTHQGCSQTKIENKVFAAAVASLLSNTVETIEVKTLRDTLSATNWVLLDAREKKEYEVSHLANAQWVGYDTFTMDELVDVDTEDTIVVYCSVGYRSEKIGEQLLAHGYQHVLNLYGGIFEWVNQGGTVVAGNSTTDKVHGYNKKWSTFLRKGTVVLD